MPKAVYNAVDLDELTSILFEETLPTYSEYYPKIENGIVVYRDNAIPTVNKSNNTTAYPKYIIPMEDELYPYIDISVDYYPINYAGGTMSNPNVAQAAISRVSSAANNATVLYVVGFEAPNILTISPVPYAHVDFTVDMKRVRKLSEIKVGYHEWVKQLYEADVKIALFNKFYEMVGGGTYGGVELKDYISQFEGYEDKREELLEKFQEDSYKDPDMFNEMMLFSN